MYYLSCYEYWINALDTLQLVMVWSLNDIFSKKIKSCAEEGGGERSSSSPASDLTADEQRHLFSMMWTELHMPG